jgi:SAM-dependent methyltransferase
MARTRPEQVADALVVTFTEGMSLTDWDRAGLTAREWTLYERLRPLYPRIVLVTWGGAEDRAIADRLGAELVCNERGLGAAEFAAQAAGAVSGLLALAGSVVVKTNQMMGGEAAAAIVSRLRESGRAAALVARGGYHWSRFAAWEHGPASGAAGAAAEREGRLCRAADVVLGTTRSMVEDLCWRHGLAPDRALVVPNYVDASGLPSRRQRTGDELEILYAGRLERQKRVHLLLEAAALLPAEVRNRLCLTIIGEGSEGEDLRALASRLCLRVRLEGRVPHRELLSRMAAATVYCQTSAYEGHPKTVIEAMACGCPVVVADASGVREVVRDARTGLIADADPRSIARSLELVLNDGGLGRALGDAAAAWARERYSLEVVLPLEVGAHRLALERARGARPGTAGLDVATAVRFDAQLVAASESKAVEAWTRSIRGFARRLEPRKRAVFLAALDTPLYHLQGETAVEADGGLHPKHRLMRYHDFFVERIMAGERVIDLGCGVGALAASIAEHAGGTGATVTGMDWTESNLEKAKATAEGRGLSDRLRFSLGDITSDRAGGRYDVVVLSNVLEHLQDRPALLRRWGEWYSPKRFLIRVPAFDREWRVPWKKELGVEWRLDPTHETEYTRAQLERELREAGLLAKEWTIRWGEYWVLARNG